MASNDPAISQGQRPSRGGRGRGGRPHGQRSSGEGGDTSSSRSRGGRGGSSRGGRGRGQNIRGRNSDGRNQGEGLSESAPAPPPPPLEDGLSNLNLSGKGKEAQPEEDEDDSEVCFICANPVQHYCIAPCNHQTCHICALRLRALYKSKQCAHCRSLAESVIFTDDSTKKFQDFKPEDFVRTDDNLGIKYEKDEIFEDTVLLLRYNCPDPDCDVACLGWPTLHRHVKNIHHKSMCDLCTRNKKVFTHEHELFTPQDLRKHERTGDDTPGAVDQSGFKGHPECGFCRMRFYGDDELFTHCREKHERCHICDRRNDGRQHQYYKDYDALEVHFSQDHFLCPDEECLQKKFVVFESQMDLKAHQLEAHPNGLSKDARKDARRVDMSEFSLRAAHEPERRQGRGRGGGRDPNTEPLPQSSAQPLRRDEIAYQRQMAIQSAQSVSTRTFGGQLTQPQPQAQTQPSETYTARGPPRSQAPATVTATAGSVSRSNQAFPSLGSVDAQSIQPATGTAPSPPRQAPLSHQEQARQNRHAAVITRATNLLKNDQSKVAEFRTKISAFSKSGINATELIDSFFTLFDTSSAELGKLVKELAEIYEISAKRDGLLKAWGDWKAINEDYPSLPGPSGRPAGSDPSATTSGGSRVLKLKSSTARRSAGSAGWGSGYPPLLSGVPGASSRPSGRPKSTPWANPSGPASASGSARPSPAPSRPSSTVPIGSKPPPRPSVNADAFPALPAAAKPKSTLFAPGGGGSAVRRINGGPSTANPWAGSGAANSSTAPAVVINDNDDTDASGGKKKGNKNKKQILFQFG